ncbi:MAG: hypothetical protein O7F75_03835, partial [Alphaproteobacteria bacterium]|nr:hypothetical protein [Alphaproteobacteria bacterium]
DLLLNAANRNFKSAAKNSADAVTPHQLGRLGAAVIHPDFKIVSVTSTTVSPGFVHQRPPSISPENRLRVKVEFGKLRRYKPVRQMVLTLSQTATDKPWRLTMVEFLGVSTAAK